MKHFPKDLVLEHFLDHAAYIAAELRRESLGLGLLVCPKERLAADRALSLIGYGGFFAALDLDTDARSAQAGLIESLIEKQKKQKMIFFFMGGAVKHTDSEIERGMELLDAKRRISGLPSDNEDFKNFLLRFDLDLKMPTYEEKNFGDLAKSEIRYMKILLEKYGIYMPYKNEEICDSNSFEEQIGFILEAVIACKRYLKVS